MSKKWICLFIIFIQLCLVLTASGEASFSNDIRISDKNVDFIIYEKYSGIDAEEFRTALDINDDGNVNSSEVDVFRSSFHGNKISQYLGYLLIDDGTVGLSIDSFDIKFDGAEGNVTTSEMHATISIGYKMDSSISAGTHNIWIIGHPSIGSMRIMLPEEASLLSYDGLDYSSIVMEDKRVMLEGASGIRSFITNGRQTYEYAVSIDFNRSPFVADLSKFNYLFAN